MIADQIADATRRWRAAEARVYPVIMVRPDLYEKIIAIVRETANSLGWVDSVAGLVAVEAEAPQLVAGALSRLRTPAAELDVTMIAGAALSMREAEIGSAMAQARRISLIAAARARGDAWVLLNETEERRAHAAPLPSYHRLEMRLADGLGVHTYVELDPSTARPAYGLETVRLDAGTGEWIGDVTDAVTATHATPQPWEAQAFELRQGHRPGFAEPRADLS